MTQNIYGVTASGAQTYTGAAAALPGAAAMSATLLLKLLTVADSAVFGNFTGGNSGWRVAVSADAAPTGGNAVKVVINTNAWTTTVVLGALLGDWLLVTCAVAAGALIVYVNGEAVFTTANIGVAVTPQVVAPTLVITGAVVSGAGYTEQTLSAAAAGVLGIFAKDFPFADLDATFDHFYSAPESLRPVTSATQVWADTGGTPTAPLTPSTQAIGLVLSGDFGQPVVPAITSGTLVAPTAS